MKRILLLGAIAALLGATACGGKTTVNVNANSARPAAAGSTTPATVASPAAPSNPTSDASQGKQDFTLVNKTGVEIDKVFISPHSSNDWEEDILGRDTLPDGETVDIKFHRSEKSALWDLRIEDSKTNGIEWENLNLLEISKVTLYYENGKGRAVVE
jgi:ABC-type glycerol-3-phosphate transport system substrate-binding protein